MSKLLHFINSNENWEDILSNPPYNIEIKKDEEYILLKYNQFDSDFSNPIVQECRGCIIRHRYSTLDSIKQQYEFVCRPFDKFFNYGEEQAAEIDWSTALVTEKVDGSLIKVWYDRHSCNEGKWHVSTNGTIDAFKCKVDPLEITFGDIFFRVFGFKTDKEFQYFFSRFDRRCTYMFELTSPESKVVISYPDGLYLLAVRYNKTGEYTFWHFGEVLDLLINPNIHNVKVYKLKTLSDCIDVVKNMSMDEEGVVVSDADGNRIKIKSPEYLIKAKLCGNHVRSDESLLETIFDGKEDDLLAYCPEYSDRISSLKNCISVYEENCKFLWTKYEPILFFNMLSGRKDFAKCISQYPEKHYLFAKADRKVNEPYEFLKHLAISNAVRLLDTYKDKGNDVQYTEHE